MNQGEIFYFIYFFQKTPPNFALPVQTSEGLNFLKYFLQKWSKRVCISALLVQMSEGVNFFKEIFAKPFKKGVHFGVACPNK